MLLRYSKSKMTCLPEMVVPDSCLNGFSS
uniref:Uncharacterized protein n=1 Tax=Arundo donax TaxID=35708 RepID=A0A0A9FH90_ARUDO